MCLAPFQSHLGKKRKANDKEDSILSSKIRQTYISQGLKNNELISCGWMQLASAGTAFREDGSEGHPPL